MKVLAVEIGGTKLQAAPGTPGGDLFDVRRLSVEPGWTATDILEWVVETLTRLRNEVEAAGDSAGAVGVGFGGPVESLTGRILTSHQVEGWTGFPLKAYLEEKTGLPVRVENDANTAGWGEYVRGAGRGSRTMVYMNIGSGIGGALICDGRLYNGQGIGAAEVGHTRVPVLDRGEGEPAFDTLEHLSSGWAIEQRARFSWTADRGGPLAELTGRDPGKITTPLLAEAARRGDEYALAEIDRAARTLGIAVANVITLFCPERYVIGGGVALMGDVLFEPLRRYADDYVIECFRGRYEIVPAGLEQDVVLVGALLLAGEGRA